MMPDGLPDKLEDQIEELLMMQRVDQELSSTLNLESVMHLTLDWALRRTGAWTGMLSRMASDGTGLVPLVPLGYPPGTMIYNAQHPLPLTLGVIGKAATTRQVQYVADIRPVSPDQPFLAEAHSQLAVPVEMRGNVLGVINLETDGENTFEDSDISFVKRLAARAAIALDNARLYQESERRADEMEALYSASRIISSSLERSDVLLSAAQSVATLVNVSSVMILEYRANTRQVSVALTYRPNTIRNSPDVLLPIGAAIEIHTVPEFETVLRSQQVICVSRSTPTLSSALHRLMVDQQFQSLIITPLIMQNQTLGLIIAIEGRRERNFNSDEITLNEALATQIASALWQAHLYADVRELENLKSEMIRMASHDLRNPLGNAMGYLDVLVMSLGNRPLTQAQEGYVGHIHRSLNQINTLIEDLLTLERIDSERQESWTVFDMRKLVWEATEAERNSAAPKHQTLTLDAPDAKLPILGSSSQLRQALTNLIGNAIKYTPDGGKIQVCLIQREDRLHFEVQDNGYGISKERQARLFQRFYRAQQPGTDHISGTGLGLSLVKAIVERHEGEVWVRSEADQGSTFGFWLPVRTQVNQPPEENK